MQIQCLNKPQGNYVRRCWGTTPISGEVGLTARLHPLRRATPVTSRYTRYVALHPLRRATPDQNGCTAYGSGALPTDRVHCLRIGCTEQRWNTPQKTLPPPHVSPTDRNSRSHKSPEPHPLQRDTGSLATPHNPRAEPTSTPQRGEAATGFPATASARSISATQRRSAKRHRRASATDQAVMST